MHDLALASGPELLLIALAAGLAGFVDAIVGGGGLVLVPALFAVYPQAVPATLLGTNKGGAVWGTAWSSLQYARRVNLPWHALALSTTAVEYSAVRLLPSALSVTSM